MYCRNCGSEINNSVAICPKCEDKTDQPISVPGDERTWAMLCHLLPLIFPYLGFLAALMILMIKGRESVFVANQGKESLNFQITLAICWAALVLLGTMVRFPRVVEIAAVLPILYFQIEAMIVASLRSNKGEDYRYPLAIRLIK